MNTMGKFVVVRLKNGEHYFNLKADNSQIILTSQMYSSKTACLNSIESVRNNCSYDSRYERKQSDNNKHFFELKASDGEIIGRSETYTSKEVMENVIESVRKNGKNTSLVEEEPYF
jgi:uncharacterized protein YegP (UPF0339 family)